MATARKLINNALTLRLNWLTPGATADDDVLSRSLAAMNEVVDEMNGGGLSLWREILTQSAAGITGQFGTIGTTWLGLAACVDILGATYNNGYADIPMSPMTMQDYHERIPDKAVSGVPEVYAYDGLSTVYLYCAATGQRITLRTKQLASEFADLDTDYTLPKGYGSWLTSLLAERLAPGLLGGMPANVAKDARIARRAMNQGAEPEIINGGPTAGRQAQFLNGW